jgi:hypothetical protein
MYCSAKDNKNLQSCFNIPLQNSSILNLPKYQSSNTGNTNDSELNEYGSYGFFANCEEMTANEGSRKSSIGSDSVSSETSQVSHSIHWKEDAVIVCVLQFCRIIKLLTELADLFLELKIKAQVRFLFQRVFRWMDFVLFMMIKEKMLNIN